MTLAEALAEGSAALAAAGIEGARREARLLLCRSAGIATEAAILEPQTPLDAAGATAFREAVVRRCRHEPASRIFGHREFWSLDFRLGPATLDPRPDSETLVEAVLARLPDRAAALRVLDLGTGTGCLLLAVLSEFPNAFGVGLDRSEPAARTAQENAHRLGLASRAAFVVGDWLSPLAGELDLVLANPPYIATGEIAALPPEVRLYDPAAALDGGADGLAAYRALAAGIPRVLAPDGLAVIELGAGQAEEVTRLFAAGGIEAVDLRRDLGGIPRAFVGRKGLPQK